MYSKNKNYKITSQRILLLFVSILALLLIVALVLFLVISSKDTNISSGNEASSDTSDQINFNPPTLQEQKSGDVKKEDISSQDNKVIPPQEASVVIVDASQYEDEIEIRAFASNIVADGVCIITFSNGEMSFTKEVPAKADASTSPCLTLNVNRSEFNQSGIWNVQVVFESDAATGLNSTTVEVK